MVQDWKQTGPWFPLQHTGLQPSPGPKTTYTQTSLWIPNSFALYQKNISITLNIYHLKAEINKTSLLFRLSHSLLMTIPPVIWRVLHHHMWIQVCDGRIHGGLHFSIKGEKERRQAVRTLSHISYKCLEEQCSLKWWVYWLLPIPSSASWIRLC